MIQGHQLTAAQRGAVTAFQAQVYEALLHVPKGHVTTYKQLGQAIDCAVNECW